MSKSRTAFRSSSGCAWRGDKLLDAIVGFRIDIERIEGKWKLNQNHDPKRRTNVIRALKEAGGEDRERVAELMSIDARSP